MTTAQETFNLIDEPWIPVQPSNGSPREVSIRDLFAEATAIRVVGGDIPTQAFAIQRILLAIVRRAIDWGIDPLDRWEKVWGEGNLPLRDIEDYLDRVRDRFDLLHPATPFYQVTDFETTAGAFKPVELLITDIPSGAKYFTTRAGVGAECLTFAEAARWIVHCQTFDPSGIKSGDPRDERTKNGKGYPIGIAWGGQLGGVVFEGRNLFETLMLNNVLRNQAGTSAWPLDAPVWEREHPDVCERPDLIPLGPNDVLTWQSRRIKLQHNGEFVTGALVGNGDQISSHNHQDVEFMTSWRFSEPQSKKFGENRFFPRAFDPDRSLWRGIESLLADLPDMDGKRARGLAPGVVHWIDYLAHEASLDRSFPIRPHALGLQYINQSSVVGASIDDVLQITVALIGQRSQPRKFANRAVQVADESVTALARLAGNLAEAAGGDAEGRRATARASAYFALDAPFRQWVAKLGDDTEFEGYFDAWQRQIREMVGGMGRDLISSAGEPAWKGRLVRERWLDSSLASGFFWSALQTALPAAFETESAQKGDLR